MFAWLRELDQRERKTLFAAVGGWATDSVDVMVFTYVAITGWSQEADRQKSLEAGFGVHLVKPVNRDDLMRILGERSGSTLH